MEREGNRWIGSGKVGREEEDRRGRKRKRREKRKGKGEVNLLRGL